MGLEHIKAKHIHTSSFVERCRSVPPHLREGTQCRYTDVAAAAAQGTKREANARAAT